MSGRRLRLSAWALRFSGGFAIDYLCLALGVGFGSFVQRLIRPILSLVRARFSFGRPAWRRFRLLRFPPSRGGALMANGGWRGPFRNDRPAGDRFPKLVYAGRYLDTYSLEREVPNFK